jgi:hypothetical protein
MFSFLKEEYVFFPFGTELVRTYYTFSGKELDRAEIRIGGDQTGGLGF